jgi:hypothetical protein
VASRFKRASAHAPRVDGPLRAFARFEPTHQYVGVCNPHDPRTRLAHVAPTRQRDLSAPPLTPVRVRDDDLRHRRRMGWFKERPSSLSRSSVCTCIRSYTTTSFVWISSSRLDGRLIQPCELCATRSGAMHSPSGSLLTLRVSYWTHWKSVDRHVPCADVVPLGLDGLGLPEVRVGRPTRVLWTEPQRPFGFSELP